MAVFRPESGCFGRAGADERVRGLFLLDEVAVFVPFL